MTEIDWLIVGLLVLSSGVGITRGVVREILAIVGWVAGIMLALAFSGDFADMIPLESLGYLPRVLIASILLIVAALFCVGLLGLLIRKLLEVAELTFEDRALGAVFGFLRGAVVVCAGVFFFGLIDDVKTSKVWQQSSLIAPAETVIDWSLPYLPDWFASLRNGIFPTGSLRCETDPLRRSPRRDSSRERAGEPTNHEKGRASSTPFFNIFP